MNIRKIESYLKYISRGCFNKKSWKYPLFLVKCCYKVLVVCYSSDNLHCNLGPHGYRHISNTCSSLYFEFKMCVYVLAVKIEAPGTVTKLGKHTVAAHIITQTK